MATDDFEKNGYRYLSCEAQTYQDLRELQTFYHIGQISWLTGKTLVFRITIK